MKGIFAPKGFAHPNRVTHPLKRVGERGSGQFERVTWDEAMADIGARLNAVIEEYGPRRGRYRRANGIPLPTVGYLAAL